MMLRLEEIIPKAVVIRAPEEGGDPDGEGAPSPILDAIALAPIENPLVEVGMDEVGAARAFLRLIERYAQGERRGRRNGLAQTTGPDDEILRRSPPLAAAAAQIAEWLDRDCRGDMRLMQRVLDRFWAKFAIERFQSPDLASLVLMAYEEVLVEESGRPVQGLEAWPLLRMHPQAWQVRAREPVQMEVRAAGEMIAQGTRPLSEERLFTPRETVVRGPGALAAPIGGRAMDPNLERALPEAVMKAPEQGPLAPLPPGTVEPALGPAQEGDVDVRLVSIREALRRHLQERPIEYPAALAAVLDVPLGELGNEQMVSARLAGELARRGTWSFALRLWKEVRERQVDLINGEAVLTPALWGGAPPKRSARRSWWSICPRWDGLRLDEKLALLAQWMGERSPK